MIRRASRFPVSATGLLLCAVAACDAPPSVAVTSGTLSDTPFRIQALGDRCIGVTDTPMFGFVLTIESCDETSIKQQFRTSEVHYHDIKLVLEDDPTQCVTIDGSTGPSLAPGQLLRPQPCANSEAQQFAFDGDALLVGRQPVYDLRVSRDFVIEPNLGITNEGTPVVVGTRDLDDAEYWRMIPVDGSQTRPHSGFISIETELELECTLKFDPDLPRCTDFKDQKAEWGNVLELDPPGDEISLALNGLPIDTAVVRSGVTLRSRTPHKFADRGVTLVFPTEQEKKEAQGYVLKVEDLGRVTQLRMEATPTEDHKPELWALQVGSRNVPLEDPSNAIVDHVDLTGWSEAAISLYGTSVTTDFSCPGPRFDGPDAMLVGNFIHDLDNAYGIVVAQGAFAFIRGNYMSRTRHDVTSAFNDGFNRYVAFDNLFTGNADETIVDVHGSCSDMGGHWVGGRAGDLFEAAFNSFLTFRLPYVKVRGTPCDHFSLHHNVMLALPLPTIVVDTRPEDPLNNPCVFPTTGTPFVPGDPNDILQAHDNAFITDNPLYRRLAVGDFDGDGRSDVFLATGATWWFSSGGKAEWRFLNRMPELVSDLRFGDFDGDGRTDVVALHSDQVSVSWAGASQFFPLNGVPVAGLTIEDLAVGQFDTDPRADLFFADGSEWHWASAGSGAWDLFATSAYRTWELRFGDFQRDSITDVFRTENGTWSIVKGPGETWDELGPEQISVGIDHLVLADFDGDGFVDVGADMAFPGVSIWMMSSGGTGTASDFYVADQQLSSLPIGDFDDAVGADVLRWDDNRFRVVSPSVDEVWSMWEMR